MTNTTTATVDYSSMELTTGTDETNATATLITSLNTSTLYKLNTSTLYKSVSDALTSTTYFASSKPSVTEINTAASTHGGSVTSHNATTIVSNLTGSLTLSETPVSHQQSSTTITEFLTSEAGHVDITEASDFQSTTQYLVSEATVAWEQGSTVAIAVGVSVAVVVLVVTALIVVFVCLRRRRLRQKKKSEILMENPRYTEQTSTLPKNFDLMMHTGPMMRDHLSNKPGGNTTRTNGKRKKDAPRPPIYKPPDGGDTASKRKAPPPPEYPRDLYERDSIAGSSEALELSSFGNQNANAASAEEEESSPSKSLLESFHPQKKSPKRRSKVDDADEKTTEVNASKDEDKEEDANEDDRDEDEAMKTTLLGKVKAESSLSLDSYDKTKNPFFSS